MAIRLYSSFVFYSLQAEFRRLSANAQMSAKQELEDMLAAQQDRMFVRTYMLSGISSVADLLVWRMSRSLIRLQEMSSAMLKTGIGQWLVPVRSYLGILQKDVEDSEASEQEIFSGLGRYPYMILNPVSKNAEWHNLSDNEKEKISQERIKLLSKYDDVSETFFLSGGLDDCDYILQKEGRSLSELENASRDLRKRNNVEHTLSDKPVFFCIGRGISEILDYLA